MHASGAFSPCRAGDHVNPPRGGLRGTARLLMGLAKPPKLAALRSGVASALGTPSSSERSSCAYAPLLSSRSDGLLLPVHTSLSAYR